MNRLILSSTLAASVLMWGCGGNECQLDDPKSCPSEMTCEVVQGREEPMCFAPVEVRGKVFDLDSDAAIAGARISASDINGAPVGTVAISADDGTYALRIPTERKDEQGTPVGRTLRLRASAQDFQPFPSGLRVALPLDTTPAASEKEDAPWIVSGGASEIGLQQLPEDQQGFPSIQGRVELAAGQKGVLVVAEADGQEGRTAIADADGNFVVFNVPPGSWTVRGFSRGANYTPAPVTVEAGKDLTDVVLGRAETSTATVTGDVQIVSASGLTSVVLVVASTFNENLARGEMPPGLRAPEPGTAPNIDGTFTIEGVPDGDYVVLAAFENDGLVRDPNTNTAGTGIQRISVTNGSVTGTPSFKVTNALTVVSPGAGDALETTGPNPTFTWKSYPSAAAYNVFVFDTFGNEVWNALNLSLASSGNVSVEYAGGTALQSGRVYQWRAVALGNAGQPISQTEDLKGVFQVE